MKKDYRTSTNHGQWPRLLLYTSYYTIVWPHSAFVWPRQTIVWPQQTIVWSQQTIVWRQQTTIVCDRKAAVFRSITKKLLSQIWKLTIQQTMTDINWQYQKAITLDFVTCKHTSVCLRKKIERRMRSRSVANGKTILLPCLILHEIT